MSLGTFNGPANIGCKTLSKLRTDSGDNGFYVFYPGGKVRRFVLAQWDSKTDTMHLRELTAKQVKQEQRAAEKDEYCAAIRKFYADLDSDRYRAGGPAGENKGV